MAVNNKAYASGVIIFILFFVSLFTWIYLYSLYLIIYAIGTILFFISGLLYLVGGVKNSRGTIGTGFGFGLPGWSMILISCILGLFWNLSKLAEINFMNLIDFYFILKMGPQNSFYFIIMMMDSIFGMPRRYNIGYIGSIIHIPIAIVAMILGIISLIGVSEDKW